jgi:uncharacterized membrane protein
MCWTVQVRLPLPLGTRLLVTAFAVSGVAHLVRPQLFEQIMPHRLPAHRGLVYASGVAELACAVGLQRRHWWAPRAAALVLLLVWPANGQHALSTQRSSRASSAEKALVWARFPLQLPMIRAALRSPTD